MGIKVCNITKKYNTGTEVETTVLDKIDLSIDKGELVAIVGKSGAGKSTLMHILGCLDKPTSGDYIIDDENLTGKGNRKLAKLRNKKFGYILQDFGLINSNKVIKNVMVPMMFNDTSFFSMKSIARDKLEQVGIKHLRNRYVEDLSGGEKQRVAIARALVNEPDYIFADEPTGSLDSENAMLVVDTLIKLNKMGKTVIIITHDKEVASKCNRIITINDGKIISDERKDSDSVVEIEYQNVEMVNQDAEIVAQNTELENLDVYIRKVEEVFFSIFDISDENIKSLGGLRLIEDLGFDSVAILRFASELERYFKIQFTPDELTETINEFDKTALLVKTKLEEV